MKLEPALDILDEILNLSLADLKKQAERNRENLKGNYLISGNIENIEFGITGYLFFLLEHYKEKESPRLLEKIERLTLELIAYCDQAITANYSLYTGRGGVVYFLLELYKENGKAVFLENAVKLIKESENEFLDSVYTSDYFLDGRAGMIFILLTLFKINKSKETEQLINTYLNIVLDNSILSSKGISWIAKEEINIENSCDFARGALGVLFTLKYIDSVSGNDSLSFYITQTEKYIENGIRNLNEDIVLDQYQFISVTEKKHILTVNSHKEDYIRIFKFLSDNKETEVLGNNLPLLLLLSPSVNSPFISLVRNIFDGENTAGQTDEITGFEEGFLAGKMGVAYAEIRNNKQVTDDSGKKEYTLSLEVPSGEDFIFRKRYPKFYEFTKVNFPAVHHKILMAITTDNIHILANILLIIETDSYVELFKDLLFWEENKNLFYSSMMKNNNWERFSDIVAFRNSLFNRFEDLGDAVLDVPLQLSSKAKIINTKWNWSSDDMYLLTLNIIKPPGAFAIVLTPSYDSKTNYTTETVLNIEEAILRALSNPKTTRKVCAEFKFYCLSQPDEAVDMVVKYTHSKDKADLIERLDYLVIRTIKNFVYNGCLEFVE
ncbi:lanthionine synthetase LanC family protein [Chryseobacterium sp. LAM-KRS1]|uniref:lanthionine synthetase LanC family protein n=1 Tax=Chryseobacterium sp. LAM-KRS1 TaxID=2715754 RepID=UPI0015544A64|nr:lanthionine synthetase LanC family protein [Chryseobacterium sp. LAM-KRS1]